MRVFFSYSHRDIELAKKIQRRLKNKDYLVFDPNFIPGDNWIKATVNAIEEASRDGCVIVLITPNSLQSNSVQNEIMFASREGGNIIPIIVGDTKLNPILLYELSATQTYNLSENPTNEEIDEMIDKIGYAIAK